MQNSIGNTSSRKLSPGKHLFQMVADDTTLKDLIGPECHTVLQMLNVADLLDQLSSSQQNQTFLLLNSLLVQLPVMQMSVESS